MKNLNTFFILEIQSEILQKGEFNQKLKIGRLHAQEKNQKVFEISTG